MQRSVSVFYYVTRTTWCIHARVKYILKNQFTFLLLLWRGHGMSATRLGSPPSRCQGHRTAEVARPDLVVSQKYKSTSTFFLSILTKFLLIRFRIYPSLLSALKVFNILQRDLRL